MVHLLIAPEGIEMQEYCLTAHRLRSLNRTRRN